MKKYKDKNSNSYKNSIEYKRDKNTRFVSGLLSILLASNMCLSIMSLAGTTQYKLQHTNPFEGKQTYSSEIISLYQTYNVQKYLEDKEFLEFIKNIKNLSDEEKKAYTLYYSLITNDNFTDKEKHDLRVYINYVKDNKYYDYEKMYDKLLNIVIKRDVNFVEEYPQIENSVYFQGTADYDKNMISLGKGKDGEDSLLHELCHMDNNTLPKWYEEGMTDLISEEYGCKGTTSYNFQKNVIRLLCEIIGKDKGTNILFKTKATGDFNILKDELLNSGVPKELCDELFELLDEYHLKEVYNGFSNEIYEMDNFRIDEEIYCEYIILSKLAKMYEITHINEDKIDTYILYLFDNPTIKFPEVNLYYLNSEKIIKDNFVLQKEELYYPKDLSDDIMNERIKDGNIPFIEVGTKFDGINYIKLQDSNEIALCNKEDILTIKYEYKNNEVIIYKIKNNKIEILNKMPYNENRFNYLLEIYNNKVKIK